MVLTHEIIIIDIRTNTELYRFPDIHNYNIVDIIYDPINNIIWSYNDDTIKNFVKLDLNNNQITQITDHS